MNECHNERLFAKKILERADAFSWSVQGLGMFRLYLSEEIRLHVWDPRFAVENVTTIHTHPWDFQSTVLWGELKNLVYRVVDPYEEDAEAAVPYARQTIVCGPGGGKVPGAEPERVLLLPWKKTIMRSGEWYDQAYDDLHETEAVSGTVTLVDRVFRKDREHASVFHPVMAEWVSAEPREAKQAEVRAMAKQALALEKAMP